MATAVTDTVTVATAAGIAATAEAIDAEAATETIAGEMTAAPVQTEVTMTDTDAAARATDTAEDEGIEAVTTTVVEDVLARALHAVTGHAVRGKDLAIASVVVRTARVAAVRRPQPQKLQKTIVTSVLSSSSRSPSVPRHVISAPSSRSLDLSSKPKSSKTELLAARRGKLSLFCT